MAPMEVNKGGEIVKRMAAMVNTNTNAVSMTLSRDEMANVSECLSHVEWQRDIGELRWLFFVVVSLTLSISGLFATRRKATVT